MQDLGVDPARVGVHSIDEIREGYFLYHLKWSRKVSAGPPVRQPRHLIVFFIDDSKDIIVARIDTLFLALPVSWKGTLVQYAGRLHRLHPGKRKVRIIDYVDSKAPMLARMFERRRVGYRAMGYREGDSSLAPNLSSPLR